MLRWVLCFLLFAFFARAEFPDDLLDAMRAVDAEVAAMEKEFAKPCDAWESLVSIRCSEPARWYSLRLAKVLKARATCQILYDANYRLIFLSMPAYAHLYEVWQEVFYLPKLARLERAVSEKIQFARAKVP